MELSNELSAESWRQARALLDVSEEVTAAELRTAYVAKVRQHPPDRDPEQFERIRDAFDLLRDPKLRARQILLGGVAPTASLDSLLEQEKTPRKYVGPGPWLDVLKERRA